MVRIVFSLDTEDYVTPEHDEAVKFWSGLFASRSVRGCFSVVAEYARQLRQRGRKDVISLLSKNEIDYHSNLHSFHPTFPEYLDKMEWDAGVQEVIKKEVRGIKDVEDIFGMHPSSYMQPGGSFAPQVLYAMGLLGIPAITWTFLSSISKHKPLWYCNELEGIHWNLTFDDYFETGNFAKMKADFTGIYEKEKKAKDGLIILGTHPCKLVAKEFWDGVNFNGRNTPEEKWKPATLRPVREFNRLKKGITGFVDWMLKKPGIKVITYKELYELYKQPEAQWISQKGVRALASGIIRSLDHKQYGKAHFSPAEIFCLLSFSLSHSFPSQVLSRRIAGPVSDFPDFKGSTKVSSAQFLNVCKEVNEYVNKFNRVPSEISIGRTKVGPGCFIRAMAQAVLTQGRGAVVVKPSDDLPVAGHSPDFNDLVYKDNWLFVKGFSGLNIIRQARLQSWTIKPA